ncbi:MAG: hypothetical protein AABY93_02835 [Bacteroidota bacterium]
MRILLLVVLISWGANVAASDLVKWSQGIIVMVDGEVRQGELAFQVSEIVLFRDAGVVTVFPANKVRSFRNYDQEENINRKFVSRASQTGRIASFYEIVVWGEVSVMRKLKSQVISNQENSDKDGYDYFICFQNNLVNLRHFRSKVYPNLISSSSQMEVLISCHHFNPNNKADAIQIIQFYNRVTYTETLVAGT